MNTKAIVSPSEAGQSKAITNFWLLTLSLIVGMTILCTAVMVGWPIIAHLASKFMA